MASMNDYWTLRSLRRKKSSRVFADSDDEHLPPTVLTDLAEPMLPEPWQHPVTINEVAVRRPPPVPIRPKRGHASVEDFFASRDRRKNKRTAGVLRPADIARRIQEINAEEKAINGGGGGEDAGDYRDEEDATSGSVDVEPEMELDCDDDSQSSLPWKPVLPGMRRELVNSTYLPPHLRSCRPAQRKWGAVAGGIAGGSGEAPDISCQRSFPTLDGTRGLKLR